MGCDKPGKRGWARAAAGAALLAAALASAAEDGARNWKDEAELRFANKTGNTRTSALSAENRFRCGWERGGLELGAGALVEKEKGRVTAEEYEASEKATRAAVGKIYLYELFRWDRDRFSGVLERYGFSAGAGEELRRTGKDRLTAEAGLGVVSEERPERTDRFQAGRLYGRYERALSATGTFSQDAEYIHDFADPRDFRLRAETAVASALGGGVSIKAFYKWKRSGRPSAGYGKDDAATGMAFILSR